MDPSVDDDLIRILKNTSLSKKIRAEGWKYILSLSASEVGLKHLLDTGKYPPFLLSYISQESEGELIKLAYKALINIAASKDGTSAILSSRKDICSYLLQTISEKTSETSYKCYLLANMSAQEEAVKIIIDILVSSRGLLSNLLTLYCSRESSYDFLTLVFANVSRLTEGRRLFLKDDDFLRSILKFTQASEPESRRLGAALILRNCCLETEYHNKLLQDVGIMAALLLPLMVPQQYEEGGEMGALPPELQQQCLDSVKGRDESASVRRVLVEALAILCYSESGWRYLKTNGAYYVVRDLHKAETDVVTKATVEQLVTYFLVNEYDKQRVIDMSVTEEVLTKQLEADFIKDLPDFVI